MVVAVLAVLAAALAIALVLFGREALAFLTDGRRVQEQAARLGPAAPLALAALIAAQEATAVLPSEPLELAAGYAFGFGEGVAVCLAGGVAGALAIVGIVRLFGERALRLFVSPERLAALERRAASDRFEVALLVFFLIPGLPKDIMTYAAALARIPAARVVLITTAGRLPSIVAATLASSFAAAGDWRATAIVFAATALLALGGLALYHRIRSRT